VYGKELVIPLAKNLEDNLDDGYTSEVVRLILAAKGQGLAATKPTTS